jgi:hypothetical protein
MPPQDYTQHTTESVTMTIKVDGVAYRFDMRDVSAKMELDLYNESGGLRLLKVMEEVQDGPTGFHIAAIIYLARKARGEQVTFDEVASHMGLGSEIEVLVGDETEIEQPPEDQAAS